MLHTKSQGNQPNHSGEDFLRVFTIYGRGSHLGHGTKILQSHYPRRLHIKFQLDRPRDFLENHNLNFDI